MPRPVARRALALALLVALLATPWHSSVRAARAAPPPAFYAVTALAVPDGAIGAPRALNEAGQVVGEVYAPDLSLVRAARWDAGVPTVLGGVPDRAAGSRAYAINASGQIAGEWWDGPEREAFVHHGGTVRALGTLGGRSAGATDINDAGRVVGVSVVPDQPVSYEVEHAFLWQDGRGMRDLGTLPGYRRSRAEAINNAGQVVGVSLLGYSQASDGRPYERAFRWTAEAGMRPLAGLDGDDASWASDVNDAGQIVGFHTTAGTSRGFLWSEDGGVRDLGALPGHAASAAAAVNNRGWVVGHSQRQSGDSHATLFAHGQAIDLNGLIPPDSGWLLTATSDINDAGQILGFGVRDGVAQGILLTPTGAPGAFCDVAADAPYAAAVAQLATEGIIGGYGDGCFGPATVASRAQAAALVARAMPAGSGTPTRGTLTPPACLVGGSWDCEDWGNDFADRSGLPQGPWRAVGTLAHYGVASGYDGARFGPNDPVRHAQAVALIARAMVVTGRWVWQPDGPSPPAGVPAAHDRDLRTFLFYAGDPPDLPSGQGWSAGATRGWLAQVLALALAAP